ncbi:MAG TPA: UPF0182 family protein, partial [Desulfuromonadaceae bacterium]
MLKKNRFIIIFAVAFVLLLLVSSLLALYTDWLFFVETGFSSVFTTTMYAKTGTGLLFGGLLFIFVQANLYYANGAHFPLSGIFIVGGGNLRVNRDEAAR